MTEHDIRVTASACNDGTGAIGLWCATCKAWLDVDIHWVDGRDEWLSPEQIAAAVADHGCGSDPTGGQR